MMSHEAGVRTVVMGGQPKPGPMQAAAGTRGAMPYYSNYLDIDITNAEAFNTTTKGQLPQRDSGMAISYVSFNLRDQVRTAGSPSMPLQFMYEAADCRLYFTLDNVLNMTRLWRDVANAAWTDSSVCVAGSTGYSTTGNKMASSLPPQNTATEFPLPVFGGLYAHPEAESIEDISFDGPLQDVPLKNLKYCEKDVDICIDYKTTTCQPGPIYSADGHPVHWYCLPKCNSNQKRLCGTLGTCSVGTKQYSQNMQTNQQYSYTNVQKGYCIPNIWGMLG
jgi:hypothetical protein